MPSGSPALLHEPGAESRFVTYPTTRLSRVDRLPMPWRWLHDGWVRDQQLSLRDSVAGPIFNERLHTAREG
ncbi:hypothetical protein D3C81_429640 [compost metagenome]